MPQNLKTKLVNFATIDSYEEIAEDEHVPLPLRYITVHYAPKNIKVGNMQPHPIILAISLGLY